MSIVTHTDLFRSVVATATALNLDSVCPILTCQLKAEAKDLVKCEADEIRAVSLGGASIVADELGTSIVLECCRDVIRSANARSKESDLQLTLITIQHIRNTYERILEAGVSGLVGLSPLIADNGLRNASSFHDEFKALNRTMAQTLVLGDEVLASVRDNSTGIDDAQGAAYALLQDVDIFKAFHSVAQRAWGVPCNYEPKDVSLKSLEYLGLITRSRLTIHGKAVAYHVNEIARILLDRHEYSLSSLGESFVNKPHGADEEKMVGYLADLTINLRTGKFEPKFGEVSVATVAEAYMTFDLNDYGDLPEFKDKGAHKRANEKFKDFKEKFFSKCPAPATRLGMLAVIRYGLVTRNPYHSAARLYKCTTPLVLNPQGLKFILSLCTKAERDAYYESIVLQDFADNVFR